LGKYRIERLLATGGFADVYRAYDTIEAALVALKLPHGNGDEDEVLDAFRKEIRLAARLDHPHILPIKNAEMIDGQLVIASALGAGTLGDRLKSRLSLPTAVQFAEQMLSSLSYAHRKRIVHCDVKPDNFILFPGDRLRLTDFGLAKVVLRTIEGSGSGTLGYLAPEQALGKPSFRSDVFSLALIFYRMFSGRLPEWPYEWPLPGFERVKRILPPEANALLRRCLEVDARKRFEDAVRMEAAFLRLKPKILRTSRRRQSPPANRQSDWRQLRRREFARRFGRKIEANHACSRCGGPIAEAMKACPWCGADRRIHRGSTSFPRSCPRCHRGLKLDWRFCPWCHGPSIGPASTRRYGDVRYTARCGNPNCERRELMPFMAYCPWCRRKVKQDWKIPASRDRCRRCHWGVIHEFWQWCPWCTRKLEASRSR